MEIKNSKDFYSILIAAIYLFDYSSVDPELQPRDVPQEELEREYDFVIVGGGISGTHGICSIFRGRALGGNSVINNLLYVRGNRRDYDKSPQEIHVTGWTYSIVLPYFIKAENASALGFPISKYRGYKGPLRIEYAKYRTKIQPDYFIATKEYGVKNILTDYNARVQEDTISKPQLTMTGHIRQTAARAYLYPVKDRENLDIIKYSFAVKILLKKDKAFGVQYVRNGNLCTVRARKEVLISAGAFNSPKLLMLSGIGPKKELMRLGIPVVADLPVGKRLIDQPGISVSIELNRNVTITTDKWKTKEAILKYVKKHKGPLTTTGLEEIYFNGKENSTESPTIQFSTYSMRFVYDVPQHRQVITILATLTNPQSVGYMTLRSSDPYDPPLINPNYLAAKNDYTKLYNAIEAILIFMKTPTMQKYGAKLFYGDHPKCKGLNGGKFQRCLMSNYITSHNRPLATTTLGNLEESVTVVDSALQVKGIKRLRVVGSSNYPYPLTGSTSGFNYGLTEGGADIIKAAYGVITVNQSEG